MAKRTRKSKRLRSRLRELQKRIEYLNQKLALKSKAEKSE